MSLDILKTTGVEYNLPVFRSILEDIPGGIVLKTNRMPSATKYIKMGAIISADATTAGLYNLVKTAKLKRTLGTSACVTIYVYPTHELIVGEYLGVQARGSAATIASISKASGGANTDAIIFTAGGGGLNATAITGTVLEECSAAAVTAAAPLHTATAVLKNTVRVRHDDLVTVGNVAAGAVVRGTVKENILPYSVTAADKVLLTSRIRFA